MKFPLTFLAIILMLTCSSQQISNIDEISKSIITQLEKQNVKNIAVIDFTNPDGQLSALGKSLSNKLRINLTKNSNEIKIVNRSVLKEALKEEQLFKDGIINPESAKKINFKGIEAIILGEISDYGNSYSSEIQIINTETSGIIGGEILEIPQTESIKNMYENIIQSQSLRRNDKTSAEENISSSNLEFPITQDFENIKIRVDKISKKSNTLIVHFKVYNKRSNSLAIGVYSGQRSKANTQINVFGDIYHASLIKIGNKSTAKANWYAGDNILSKSWVKGFAEFKGIEGTDISLINISFYSKDDSGQKQSDFTLRNVKLQE